MAALEADAAFERHLTPRLALEPLRHLGGVGIEFAILPLREVDFVHDFTVEDDGDFRALGGEGQAIRLKPQQLHISEIDVSSQREDASIFHISKPSRPAGMRALP